MRATGEGHISSISFLDMHMENNDCVFPERSRLASLPTLSNISDLGYRAAFSDFVPLSERVLFPVLADEIGSVEDLRLVYHIDDGCYYGTFTAYDKTNIKQKLLKTQDFVSFEIIEMIGNGIKDKNFALFPKKIDGRYAMLSRQDGYQTFLMYSNDITRWDNPQVIESPLFFWEGVKIGNCGAPIKIPEGWLMMTHGVGPMREYCLGATLLDEKDPSIVLALTQDPLLRPTGEEREGYVPNVLYSCGAILEGSNLRLWPKMKMYLRH